jgi:serine/threonine-protein kinase
MLGRVFMGRYETIRLLGEGGMGRVYLARQLDLGRQVVVKVMHEQIAADPKFRDRFTRETLLMARFQHPYAVTLYDASLDDPEGSCIVMEYIRGVTLETLLVSTPRLPAERVGRLLRQISEALQAAHSQGIIHRDLKPANIMVVDQDTPYEMVKVMDFGLAKLLVPDGFTPMTVSNVEFAVGTPGYMCPEQARGVDMDHRGDLYSLGVILYEMLVGRLPFEDRSTMDILIAHAQEQAPTFSFAGAGGLVPPQVEAVVLSVLEKDPDLRPGSARELADRFEAALAEARGGDQPGSHHGKPRPPVPKSVPAAPHSHGPNNNEDSPSGQPRPFEQAPAPPRISAKAQPQTSPTPETRRGSLIRVPASGMPAAAVQTDPGTIVRHLDAWMPERVASYKLSGFIQDKGAELVETVPGRIRVRLGGKACAYEPADTRTFLGIRSRGNPFDIDLHMVRIDANREDQLRITIVFHPSSPSLHNDPLWEKLCGQIFCDLRGYLMG